MLNLLTVATATAGASQTSYGDQLSFATMRASQKRDEPGRMRKKAADKPPAQPSPAAGFSGTSPSMAFASRLEAERQATPRNVVPPAVVSAPTPRAQSPPSRTTPLPQAAREATQAGESTPPPASTTTGGSPSTTATGGIHPWVMEAMGRAGLESTKAVPEALPERLQKLAGKFYIRAKVDPNPSRVVPKPLPAIQHTHMVPKDYHRVMSFAEEYGLLSRGK